MTTVKVILDKRAAKDGKAAPLKISICHERQTSLISLNVYVMPHQWDSVTEKVIDHPNQLQLNAFIGGRKVEVEKVLISLLDDEIISGMRAKDVKDYILAKIAPKVENAEKPEEDPNTFIKWFDRFTGRKQGRTKAIYEATRSRLVAWLGEAGLAKVKFEDIKISWLESFNDFLAKTCKTNSIAIHMRNIRTVVNYAIDNEVTNTYAFRRFKIKSEATRKRNFDITTLRAIFSAQGLEEWEEKYRDFFALTFMLVGINVVDLCNLEEIVSGRVNYIRAKTHRPYSIKVEPEALALIEKYSGEKHLLNYLDGCVNYRHFYNNLCKGLKAVKEKLGLSELTTYWARHSWATIAASLDIPKDTIAAALGHGGNTVTDIYIEYDMSKVDDANRKVLDWVLYGNDWRKPVEAPAKRRGRPRKAAEAEAA